MKITLKKILENLLVGLATFSMLTTFFIVVQVLFASIVKEKVELHIGFPLSFAGFELNDKMEYSLYHNWNNLGFNLIFFWILEFFLTKLKKIIFKNPTHP